MVVVLCVHGDRDGEAERVLSDLLRQMRSRKPGLEIVGATLLDSTKQIHLATVLTDLAEKGESHIVLMPWFLFAGPHVRNDIPAMVQSVKKSYPSLEVTILDPLGADPVLVDLLEKRITRGSMQD